MKPLIIDTEGSMNGHVFNYDHKMFILGLYNGQQDWVLPVEWGSRPYGQQLVEAQEVIDEHDLLIAFHAKHDIQWLRRYGLKVNHKKLWCLQYAEYCLSGQSWRMPDLDTACKQRSLPSKLLHIKENYWDKGKEINEAPWEEAYSYNQNDLKIEFGLFENQKGRLKDKPLLKKLIWEGSQDLLITAEMEWNGLAYAHDLSLREGNKRLEEVRQLESKLYEIVPIREINWGSSEHISAVLYGGVIRYDDKEEYWYTYANPKRPPALKYRKVQKEHTLPQLVRPFPNTKSAKEGKDIWSTEEGILRRLKATGKARDIIDTLLAIRGLNKLVGTYYHGIPKLAREMNWKDGIIHGELHHTVTQTGRLSSSKPNQQNLEYGVRQCLTTRFPLVSENSITKNH